MSRLGAFCQSTRGAFMESRLGARGCDNFLYANRLNGPAAVLRRNDGGVVTTFSSSGRDVGVASPLIYTASGTDLSKRDKRGSVLASITRANGSTRALRSRAGILVVDSQGIDSIVHASAFDPVDLSLLWEFSPGDEGSYRIAVTDSGHTYLGKSTFSGGTFRRIDPDGNMTHSVDQGPVLGGLAVDHDSDLYATFQTGSGGDLDISADVTAVKISSDLSIKAWEFISPGSRSSACPPAISADGRVAIGTNNSTTARCYVLEASSGSLITTINVGANIWSVAFDAVGNLYIGGSQTSSRPGAAGPENIWSFDSEHFFRWSNNILSGQQIWGVAANQLPLSFSS